MKSFLLMQTLAAAVVAQVISFLPHEGDEDPSSQLQPVVGELVDGSSLHLSLPLSLPPLLLASQTENFQK